MDHLLKKLLVLLTVGISLLLCLVITTDNELYMLSPPSPCYVDLFFSFKPQGRLGNRICEFIHLIHAHKTHSIKAFIHPEMWEDLHDSFPYISLPTLSEDLVKEIENHQVQYGDAFAIRMNNFTTEMLLLGSPCNPLEFWGSRTHWRRELVFSLQLQEYATTRKLEIVKWWQNQQAPHEDQTAPKVSTVIGVHVRRGDYHKWLMNHKFDDLLPPEYYHRAFQFFRERYDVPLFVILTELSQRAWCREWLANGTSDVIVLHQPSTPIQDLALLASMEHIIYSHGTFGLTAILLSNIKTLVYPAINPNSSASRYFPYIALDGISQNWTSVNFVTVSST